jgi:thioesterase domain-containing protein
MTKLLTLAMVASALLAGGAHAQSRPKPDDPATRAAPIAYDSAFKGYQPFRDEPLAPWREVNDTAHRVGGHVGVLRAEQQAAVQPAVSAPPPANAMPQGMHGGNSKNSKK